MTIFSVVLMCLLTVTVFLFIRSVRLGKKLKEMANTDALTDIFNRRFFMELSEIQISRSLRTGIDCFVIIFDLDFFKKVNDTYGHQAGDKVLKEVAHRVKNTIRAYDILGRYGGEEFIIFMTAAKAIKKDDVINAAERIRLEICNKPVEYEGLQIPISASFGISYASPKYDMDTATKYADEALYKAKNTGRNKVVFYGDE